MAGALFAAHLSGWAYRNVDDHMGRARRDLLGQDRGNELAFGIDVQLALDAHELVVSGTEVDGAAPGDAASLLFDHALQRGKVQVHRGKRSEEHTSELQSLMRTSYAVFCLKKKTKQMSQHTTTEQQRSARHNYN